MTATLAGYEKSKELSEKGKYMKSALDNQLTTTRIGRDSLMKSTTISSMVLASLIALSGCMADFGDGDDSQDEAGEVILGEAVQDEVYLEESFKTVTSYCNGFKNNEWNVSWKAMEQEARDRIDWHRTQGTDCPNGEAKAAVSALSGNHSLRCAGRIHSDDMATQNYFSHTGLPTSNPANSTPSQRASLAGFTGTYRGENIAAGYTTGTAVVDGWMNSPGHCRNIMNPDSNRGHVGYAHDSSSDYKHYWTIVFGKI